jgi:transposase
MRADRRWRTRKEKKEWARRLQSNDPGLDVIHPQAAGIDVGNASHYVAVRPDRDPEPVRQFKCFTADLHRLADWLKSCGVRTIAIESTGVYWKPVCAILEGTFQIVVANAQHVKKVPGRKTDVKDAEWIADLLCHGLLRPSFVPPKPSANCAI